MQNSLNNYATHLVSSYALFVCAGLPAGTPISDSPSSHVPAPLSLPRSAPLSHPRSAPQSRWLFLRRSPRMGFDVTLARDHIDARSPVDAASGASLRLTSVRDDAVPSASAKSSRKLSDSRKEPQRPPEMEFQQNKYFRSMPRPGGLVLATASGGAPVRTSCLRDIYLLTS